MANIFGTDGIRNQYGRGWLTPSGVYAIGHAIGHWITHHNTTPITIGIARDTRASQDAIVTSLTGALTLYPVTIIDYGVFPTSALVALAQKHDHTCSIMVTASHNPAHDNGIKLYGPQGTKSTPELETYISSHAQQAYSAPHEYEQQSALNGTSRFGHITKRQAYDTYAQFIRERVHPDLTGIRVSVDMAAGATHYIVPSILQAYGAEVRIASPDPDGYNINDGCGSTQPHHLQSHVIKHNSDIGLAFDGDGDRLMLVSRDGTIRDGDDMLALLLQHPAYVNSTIVVGTHMSNMGLEQHLTKHNVRCVRAAVGDKNVSAELATHNASLGGEPSGHIILSDLHSTGDGILTALRVLEAVQSTGNWHLKSFYRYTQVTYTIYAPARIPLDRPAMRDILTKEEQAISGRIFARYSGTEPVLRLMVESEHPEEAHTVGQRARDAIESVIKDAVCDT